MDYCNSLFRSLSNKELRRLQCLQNSIARIIIHSSKFTHVTPILKDLHWLPVKYRSIFKTVTLVYKFLLSGNPKYFGPHVKHYCSSFRSRRSKPSNKYLQKPTYNSIVHKSKKEFNNSFSYDAPNLWNNLPDNIRLAPTLTTFRSRLKTYLFQQAFPP